MDVKCYMKVFNTKKVFNFKVALDLADRLQCTTLYVQHFSYLCHNLCKICSFQRRSTITAVHFTRRIFLIGELDRIHTLKKNDRTKWR